MQTRDRRGNATMRLLATLMVLMTLVLVGGALPNGWRRVGRAPHALTLRLTFALTQRNLDVLEEHFWRVSTPTSVDYGRHWSKERITELVAPSRTSVDKVTTWLRKRGVRSADISLAGNDDYLDVMMRVELAERIFDVELFEYVHARARDHFYRTAEGILVSVPSELSAEVELISGLSGLPPFRSRRGDVQTVVERTRASQDASAGIPVIANIIGTQNTLYTVLVVTCTNAPGTNDTQNPCADHPPAVQRFNIYLNGVLLASPTPAQAQCSSTHGSVTCSPSVAGLTPYREYNVTVSTVFTNGVESGAGSYYGINTFTTDFVTPQLAQQQYGIPQNTNGGLLNNSQGVGAFGGQYFNPKDMQLYYSSFGIPVTNVTIIGPDVPSVPGGEAELDIQWIHAMGQGVPTTFWSIGFGGFLLEFGKDLNGASNPPLVMSLSYGGGEDPLNQQYGPTYMDRCDVEWQKLGLRGVTVIGADGDAGATAVGQGSDSCTPFQPQYPGSSPFVTSVSASYLTPSSSDFCYQSFLGTSVQCDRPLLEVAVSADNGLPWTTGGGFSNRTSVTTPAYQQQYVAGYLASMRASLPPTSLGWLPSSRGFPDVSMVGHNGVVYVNGAISIEDGTSMSAPTFAGFVSQLNAVRLAAGRPSLGFLNPLLYAAKSENAAAFFDITIGNNRCGDPFNPPHIVCCAYGFQAAVGWDPVSGLGSPNFAVLADYVRTH